MQRLHIPGIEINAVMQCNLACAGCSHASPVSSTWVADPNTVLRDLMSLRTVADVDEVRVVGGEPLLHPEFTELLKAVAAAELGAIVRVITNGTRLHHVDWSWLDHANEVYVSVYPGAIIRPEALDELRRRGPAAGTQVAVNHFRYFRPVVPRKPLREDETMAVFETCQVAHAWSCHTVQEGYVYLCPMTVPAPASGSGRVSRCPIEPLRTLFERLSEFLHPTAPLPECHSCLGTVGQLTPHRQSSRKTWLALSTSEIDWAHLERLRADPWTDNGCVNNAAPLRS